MENTEYRIFIVPFRRHTDRLFTIGIKEYHEEKLQD